MTLLLSIGAASLAKAQQLPLMPMPSHVDAGAGAFVVDGSFAVALEGYSEPRLVRARQRFLGTLSRETGIPFLPETQPDKPRFFIQTGGPSQSVQQLGEDESYRLTVSTAEVHLAAANPLGVLRGLQTFLQLVQITPQGFAAPAVTIDDQPRFPWRGLMIDSGRHFMPLDVIRRNLDGMEAVKLNVLHWHLSENQGFRVESKKYPLLQQKGSDGLFYTQQEIRDILEYAHDRGIRVVPEFDMPGHATAWFVGYPDLASGKGPYTIDRQWGVFDPAMDPTRESTYEFLNGFIGEMAALFPDAYFHIGGDECNGKEWDANPHIQEFMRAHSLKDDAALQAYFTARIQKIVTAQHKTMEGWDEVLQPNTPTDVVIQSWRGQDSLAEAAKRGYKGLLSNGYYIDLNQPAVEHYLVDPMGKTAADLPNDAKQRILGGEATMWSEFVTPENVDSRIWPRTAAIAERYWSPESVTDVASMYERMAAVSLKLEYYGLQHRASYKMMLARMTGQADPATLRVLGDVVQPPRGYARGSLRSYDSFSPLNRLVDAVPPESDTARHFHDLVRLVVSGRAAPGEAEEVRSLLVLWRDNDARLQPLLAKSELTSELAPLSTSLRQVAEIGLAAFDLLQKGGKAPAGWRDQQLQFLKQAAEPQAVLLNMTVPAVTELVQAVPAN
jgi:hexosaminidase